MNHHRQQGLTLVELMVALTLGLIVIGAIVGVFIANNQNYRQNEAVASLQDNARFAMDSLSRDLAMAGYWGGVRPIDAATNVRVSNAAAAAISTTATGTVGGAAAGDCGPSTAPSVPWLFQVEKAIEFRNHTVTQAVTARFRCLTHVRPNTDIVVIRHVSGQPALSLASGSNSGTLVANRIYLQSNQSTAALIKGAAAFTVGSHADCPDDSGSNVVCPPAEAPMQVYAYTPVIYYVRTWLREQPTAAKPDGDGIPVLCRRFLNEAGTAMEEDCIAEGVENLQVEWGVDASGNNGVDAGSTDTVTRYLSLGTDGSSELTADQLSQARTVRIHILVRSTSNNVQASNDAKTFKLADYTSPALSGQLRRSYSTTVQLKNFQL